MKLKSLLKITAAVFTGIFMCGCSLPDTAAGTVPEGIDKLYTVQCEITAGEDSADEGDALTYGGQLTRLGGGFWELSLTSPETVDGLKICLGAEGITASLGELNFNLETDKIPSRAAFMTIFSVLDNAAANANSLTLSETETNLCYHGTYNDEKYTLLYDKANNTLCGLTVGRIEVSFTAFTVTGTSSETTVSSETTSAETDISSETTVTSAETAVTTVTETSAETTQTVTVTSSPFVSETEAASHNS